MTDDWYDDDPDLEAEFAGDEDSHGERSGQYDDEDDDFDYEQFVAREFGDSPVASGSPAWVRTTVLIVLAAMVLPLLLTFLF